jgi:hypothetical protein
MPALSGSFGTAGDSVASYFVSCAGFTIVFLLPSELFLLAADIGSGEKPSYVASFAVYTDI